MTKVYKCLAAFWMGGVSLLAQSTGSRNEPPNHTTQTVRYLSGESSNTAPDNTADVTQPSILNILTVVGNKTLGLPCLDCILGILFPNLGLPTPVNKAFLGSSYQIDSYLIDNSYTGSCTFTSVLKDSHKNVIASSTETLEEKANSEILLSTPITVPNTAVIGLGSVSTTAVCGTSTTQSSSSVFVACVRNPPFCVN